MIQLAMVLAAASVSGLEAPLMIGAGASTCEQAMMPDRPGSSWGSRRDRAIWMLGYVSAHNTSTGGNVLEGVSLQNFFARVDRYCAANPYEALATALNVLLAEMEASRRPP